MGNTEEKARRKRIDQIEGIGDCEINRPRKMFKILKSNEERREEGKQDKWSKVQRKLQLHVYWDSTLTENWCFLEFLVSFPVLCSKIPSSSSPNSPRSGNIHKESGIWLEVWGAVCTRCTFAVQYREEIEMTQHRTQNSVLWSSIIDIFLVYLIYFQPWINLDTSLKRKSFTQVLLFFCFL